MAAFVLVHGAWHGAGHGAWHGAWCGYQLRTTLEQRGHFSRRRKCRSMRC